MVELLSRDDGCMSSPSGASAPIAAYLSFQSLRLEGGGSSSQKIGLWRQKLSETKVLVHSQHLGDAVPKSKLKALRLWK